MADYKGAGVDTHQAANFVKAIAPMLRSTRRSGADAEVGGFGGIFDLKACGYCDPLLVAATDGVGTKLKLAIEGNKHDTIGIDLVAMCVNDLLVQGAEPLFFLDYFAQGKLLPRDDLRAVVSGIVEGCRQSGCALIGGETAEMPGMYQDGDYDLAGFTVGAVERDQLIRAENIAAGDCLIGLKSSGFHSNGYSLIRKVIAPFDLHSPAPYDQGTILLDSLLTPTKIYVSELLPLIRQQKIKAMWHITGGGFYENLERGVPDGLAVEIDIPWEIPSEFRWLAKVGDIAAKEMLSTFNCGVGMVLAVAPEFAESVALEVSGCILGRIVPSNKEKVILSEVCFEGLS